MKAIVYTQHGLPISDPASLQDADLPMPEPGPHDLLVQIRAVAVNPVDTKVRRASATSEPKVLGWDAAGVVVGKGKAVSRFTVGDEVFYAGSIARPGSYSEWHLVDERIVGHKPALLSWAEAAAVPLTAITAWELLFDRLKVEEGRGEGQTLLVIGAAGGVGSILVQLASRLTALRVIGTASRPQTEEWVKSLGAHQVINHHQPLLPQLQALGIPEVTHVASLTHTDSYFEQAVDLLAPQGQFALIDDPKTLNALPLKRKSLSLHWELMFTRPLFQTPDMHRQHELLERVSALIDQGVLRTTLNHHFGPLCADNMRKAHALIESHQAQGKIVLEGWPG